MKNYSYERVVTGILAVLMLIALIIVGGVEVQRRAGRIPEPYISAESLPCYECHTERGLSKISVIGWKKSKHGEKGVGCNECHLPAKEAGEEILTEKTECEDKKVRRSVSFHTCKRCHKKQFEEFEKGLHSSGMKNLELAVRTIGIEKDLSSCLSCHSIGSEKNACSSCHVPHLYSTSSARKPETCARCHDGKEKAVYSYFLSSSHGTIFKVKGETWNWELKIEDWKPSLSRPASLIPDSPVCVICHMIDGSHTVGLHKEFSFKILRMAKSGIYPLNVVEKELTPEYAEEILNKRKEELKKVCIRCHTRNFFELKIKELERNIDYVDTYFLKVLPSLKKRYDIDLFPFSEQNKDLLLYQHSYDFLTHFGKGSIY
jgi:hypothetical protein